MFAGAGWWALCAVRPFCMSQSDCFHIALQLVDRCIDMDCCNTRTDRIERLQNVLECRQASFEFGEFADCNV